MDKKKTDITQPISKKEKKELLSRKETKRIAEDMRRSIKNVQMRKKAISVLKTLDLQKIRNTSGT